MQIGSFRFDRLEFAGSLGDLGTLIPLSIALVTVNRLSFTAVFLMIGLFYLFTGIYYRLPIPVQPLKVVSAIAIAYPHDVTLPIMAATGYLFGIILLLLAFTGAIDIIARIFTRPIVRGIQLGLGFILMKKGIDLIVKADLFINYQADAAMLFGIPWNLLIGIFGAILVLLLLSSRRFPAALAIVGLGCLIGFAFGGLKGTDWQFGPTAMPLYAPAYTDYINALILLVIPQIPLTIGNAIIGTTDTAKNLFGDSAGCVTNKRLSIDMGLMNLVVGLFAAMPMCHGAGGLAAHYRFGARTGGSNLMIGAIFLIFALLLGKIGISLLSAIPNAVLGVLLLFAGLELALIVRDLSERRDFFIAFLIAGIALATTNMSIAFGVGIVAAYLIKKANIQI